LVVVVVVGVVVVIIGQVLRICLSAQCSQQARIHEHPPF
jgi:uncharacterized membrane protein